MRVFVISTDLDIIQSFKSREHLYDLYFMDDYNYTVILAAVTNGSRPDMIFIDFISNDNNGAALCHHLKSEASTRDIPVILLTDMPGFNQFALKLGCNEVLQKSQDKYELMADIHQCLKRQMVIS